MSYDEYDAADESDDSSDLCGAEGEVCAERDSPNRLNIVTQISCYCPGGCGGNTPLL